MTLKERTTEIIKYLNEGIHEREETIAVSFLAALSNQNIFLFGPPGTAKSLIARRISQAFEKNSYFEYLMHRFSTPEDVFGPISITELKKDKFLRRTKDFLPQADFAFLDEIWKASPSILNTLLTIINEKVFRNGTKMEEAPLKALIAASNETPPSNVGLEAMYDRFLVRLYITSIEDRDRFEDLLNSRPARPKDIQIPENLIIKHDEWENWRDYIHKVRLSQEALKIIQDIRLAFEEKGEKLKVYVSDRRWQRAAILLKAAAFFCDRDEVNLVDCLLLRHCLWTKKKNYKEVVEIVENAVRNSGFETGFSLHEFDAEKEKLEKEINKELYHNADVYETKTIDKKKCFECSRQQTLRLDRSVELVPAFVEQTKMRIFYIPEAKMNEGDQFNPIDKNGKELKYIRCQFDGHDTCQIEMERGNYYGEWNREYSSPPRSSAVVQLAARPLWDVQRSHYADWKAVETFRPKIQFAKGTPKKRVNKRRIKSLRTKMEELGRKLNSDIGQIEAKLNEFKDDMEPHFVPKNIRDIALKDDAIQLEEMKSRRNECEFLISVMCERE